jgi:hypothetical protein
LTKPSKILLGILDICLHKTEIKFMFIHLHGYQLKWIKDLSIRHESLKLVKERAENTLEAIGIGKDFLSRTKLAQQLRERISTWNYMKLKSFCITKEMVFN